MSVRRHLKFRRALTIALSLMALCPKTVLGEEAERRPSVLMMFSGGASSPSVVGPQRAFERRLVEQLGKPVDLQTVYLDLSNDGDDSYQQTLATFLARKYSARPIDVLVVQRVEALAFALKHRDALLPGVPIVFTEVLSGELSQLTLPPDVTGVVTSGVARTVPIVLDLLPATKRVVIVSGGTDLDRRVATALQRQVNTTWPGLETERLDGTPLERQLARVAALPPDTVILFPGYYGDASGRTLVGTQALEDLAAAANAPVFGFLGGHLGAGIAGGDLVQLDVLAQHAAVLAARILNGDAAASIPQWRGEASAVEFDARQLARWNISERRLPVGSTMRFREPTLWTTYRWQALGGLGVLVAQALLIGGLVAQRRQRQHALAALADAEQRYRTVAEFGADWDYWRLPDGSLRYVSPACESLTGYTAAEFIARPSLMDEIIAEEEREAWQRHRLQCRGVTARRTLELRIRTREGQTRWVEHVCSPVTGPDGSDLGLRGSNRDVTPRKQAEEERKLAETNLRRALQEIEELRERLELDNSYMREQLNSSDDIEGILGTSDAMRYVASRVQQVAPTTSTVLLLGETGVGKSLLAQAVHELSPRRARPLITLDCAALPPSLIESELFGHEKGAFTGAQAMRRGRFEIAHGGTLFLDEVAELPLDLQGKLLRAVQSGEFERVGSNVTRKIDVRLIAATNRKLDDDVRAGRFRQDLLYRLNVFPITVPPLRQRPDDIPLLVAHFLQKHCRKFGGPPPQVSRATMKALQAREWPGNIRELENVVERALIATKGTRFDLADDAGGAAIGSVLQTDSGATRTLEQVERDYILATLVRLQWQVAGAGGAAEALGINASTLRSRMQKLQIRRPAPGVATSLVGS